MAYNKGDKEGARRRPARRRKKVCAFCADKEHDVIDYKDVNKLKDMYQKEAKFFLEGLQEIVQSTREH